MEADVDSDDEPRHKRLNSLGRPFVEFVAGYEMVTNQVQLKAMRDVGTVFGPEGRLQCLGSAALLSKEDLTMGTNYESDEARAGDYSVLFLRTRALQVEEVLVVLRDSITDEIDRLRWLISFGYNSPLVPNGRSTKPKR